MELTLEERQRIFKEEKARLPVAQHLPNDPRHAVAAGINATGPGTDAPRRRQVTGITLAEIGMIQTKHVIGDRRCREYTPATPTGKITMRYELPNAFRGTLIPRSRSRSIRLRCCSGRWSHPAK
jgi:hypothetical protein